MTLRDAVFAVMAWLLLGSAMATAQGATPRILAMGDSLMAWHGVSRQSIPNVVSKSLKEPVVDRSVSGARILYALPVTGAMGMNIAKQFRPGKWDWVILNGGGNDLLFGCGCRRCKSQLDRMISPDGTRGKISALVARLRKGGAQVIYVGYLRSPGVGSPIEGCRNEGDALEGRVAQMAARDPGVHFLSLAKLVPEGDRSFHAADMIHPSVKASAIIGKQIAKIIAR